MKLCDDVNVLSNKENSIRVGKLLGVGSKTCDEIPNNGWNMTDMEIEVRKLMQSNQIFKVFSDKIAYLICPYHPTFYHQNDAQGMNV